MTTPRTNAPTLLWLRQDLRLADNPALQAAEGPVIPVYILDETGGVRPMGGASLWWLDKSLAALAAGLEARGSRLILRRGPAARVLAELIEETGASAVHWNRLYDAGTIARDKAIKTDLTAGGIRCLSCNGGLLNEPWDIETGTGGPYKVYTPYWRAARQRVGDFVLHGAPQALEAPTTWPASDRLADWGLHPSRPDWSTGFDWTPGEAGAHEALHDFLDGPVRDYATDRDRPDRAGTSRLSPHLHFGEIGPRQVWRAAQDAAARGAAGSQVDRFLAELGWREFNHHLAFHWPDLATRNFKPEWDQFRWQSDEAAFEAWAMGQTGFPIVDAGMRELWATGFMHNRVRMIVASFLIKDLLIDWRRGEQWFWDCLVDADAAQNAANWQWVAGSGADASPWFRIFNPMTQGQKFDPDGAYVRQWVPELRNLPTTVIHAPWTAVSEVLAQAGIQLGRDYPKPMVDHGQARDRALEAYAALRAVPRETEPS
ncbi:deoxyribodipyrimidine photo-lyase [Caulobacter sp. NIBR1757]|uniref:cryptochrome/photolyase family protein n=1 Tax=Caulobacter sp. NIBR1757 TaxID=3016000 RepID=UPI0022F08297|nr:deoxyribodipyrimidine photo-lyase [Caulobacter sp. NIBR1757]WGM38877.1 Deoxyribodipyrimidine photo-lyase [Caulobacter sp. NIBR1757]